MKSIASILQNASIYPFRFEPVYKNYLWGGVRFRTRFGRDLPEEGPPTAESWEVCDHPHGQSVIRNGPLKGVTLHDVVAQRPQELFGDVRVSANGSPDRFPLILKYLDAAESLSIQVHPDDRLAEELALKDRGKTETWIIVEAEPGSVIWTGTDRVRSQRELADFIRAGHSIETWLNRVEVKPGDCFFLRPGTLHALGKGVLAAEIQTNSDLTFRLFDWNRVDAEGKPRQLMIEEGIRALSDPCEPVTKQMPRKTEQPRRDCERLVSDESFSVNRWTVTAPFSWKSDRHCHIWTVLKGSVDAVFTAGRRLSPASKSGREADPDAIEILHRGDTLLVPAACEQIRWIPEGPDPAILMDVIVEKF